MQSEVVVNRSQLGNDEVHAMLYKTADEVHIA